MGTFIDTFGFHCVAGVVILLANFSLGVGEEIDLQRQTRVFIIFQSDGARSEETFTKHLGY